MSLELTVFALALLLLGVIIEVVRRRRLSENYALLWIGVGIAGLILVAARPLVDRLSDAVGIVFGTSLVFAMSIVFLLIVCVNLSVHVSRLEERVETLAQEIALLGVERDGPEGDVGDELAEPPPDR